VIWRLLPVGVEGHPRPQPVDFHHLAHLINVACREKSEVMTENVSDPMRLQESLSTRLKYILSFAVRSKEFVRWGTIVMLFF